MKNFLILGAVALALFGVSAGLSIWLNQSKQTDEGEKGKKAGAKEKEEVPPIVRPNFPTNGGDDPAKLAAQLREQLAAVKERESRVDRRQAQIDLLLQDIRSEREVIDGLRKQVASELRLAVEKMNEVEVKAKQLDRDRADAVKKNDDLKKSVVEITEMEAKNLVKIASINDAMPPENAAKILQQLADSGKMDMAAKLLLQMKETKAAKVLAEIPDAGLAAQLLEKMKNLKRAAPTMAPGG